MKKWLGKGVCAALLCTMLAAGCSSGYSGSARRITEGLTRNEIDVSDVDLAAEGAKALTDFAVRLCKAGMQEGENTLLSPVSVFCALAMASSGAKEETLAQMEQTLGWSTDEWNRYLLAYQSSLEQTDETTFLLADSVWLTDDQRFAVSQDFLQTVTDYYGAEVYAAPFDDSTAGDINYWVKEHTGGMIEKIVDKIPQEAVMYLVSAAALDAKWQSPYADEQVQEAGFSTFGGGQRNVDMMYSEEVGYLEGGAGYGLIKPYAGGSYAFVAILPEQGMTLEEFLEELSGEDLYEMLHSVQAYQVSAGIPRFQTETSLELSEVLAEMGMPDAFDPEKADLSGLGTSTEGNIFLSRVLHSTAITVDQQGTKAGAATAVEISETTSREEEAVHKTVILDRPFLYMLVDTRAMVPLFIGTVQDPR